MSRVTSMVARTALIVGAAAAGLVVGAILTVDATAGQPEEPTPAYSVNANGQTIGPWIGGENAFQPDLVEITTDDGKRGYARTVDMSWAPATTPEEAARITKEHVNEDGDVVIPVFAADGTTKIGVATIAHVSLDPIEGEDK